MHSTPEEKQRGKEHHDNMVVMLKREFPTLSTAVRQRIQNRVSKILRKCGQDIIQVWVSANPINEAQYVSNYDFMQGKTKVYIQVQVD